MGLHKHSFGESPVASDDINDNHDFLISQIFYLSSDASRTSDDDEGFFTSDYGTMADTTNSTCFYKDEIAFCDILDYFDDGAIDGDIWDTVVESSGTVTEESSGAAGYLKLNAASSTNTSASATATEDQVNSFDLKAADCEVIMYIKMYAAASATGTYGSAIIKIVDEDANKVTIKSLAHGSSGSSTFGYGIIRLVINTATENCYLYESSTDTTSAVIDISSLTGDNWYLEFNVQGSGDPGSGSGSICIKSIGYTDGTVGSSIYYSSVETISSSTIGVAEFTELDVSISVSLSYDNGSHYTSLERYSMIEMTTGTQMIFQAEGTHPTSLDVSATGRNIKFISGDFSLIYS